MLIKDVAMMARAKAKAASSWVTKYVAATARPIRYRLARLILRKRSFALYALSQSLWHLLLIAGILAMPVRYPDKPLFAWLVKLTAVLAVLKAHSDVYYAAKSRWRKLRRT